MSTEHKAWLFDHCAFSSELADTLFRALDSNEIEGLKKFINQHYASMADPWNWGKLPDNWEELMKKRGEKLSVLMLGDLALTRYRDISDDIGLGYGFDALGEYLKSMPVLKPSADALIGGYWFGPQGKRFDPGFMGTGFTSPEQAQEHLALLTETGLDPIPEPQSSIYSSCFYKPEKEEEVQESLDRLIQIYEMAVKKEYGILFADFNDLPQSSPGW